MMYESINCRGHETRETLCQEFMVRPLTFTVLLDNQVKYSCASHALLTDKYYTFEFESHLNTNNKGTFFVGETAGQDFIQILKSKGLIFYEPQLFNPLSFISSKYKSFNSNKSDNTNTDTFKMTDLNKELYIVINLLFMAWDTIPYANIQAILEFCATAKINTQEWSIKAVNNLIGKDSYNRTLTQMINDLDYNSKIKPYKFDKISKIINSNGWKNNII